MFLVLAGKPARVQSRNSGLQVFFDEAKEIGKTRGPKNIFLLKDLYINPAHLRIIFVKLNYINFIYFENSGPEIGQEFLRWIKESVEHRVRNPLEKR